MATNKYNKNHVLHRLLFIPAKLSAIYFLMIFGILIDFMTQFPFAIICTLENRLVKRASIIPGYLGNSLTFIAAVTGLAKVR